MDWVGLEISYGEFGVWLALLRLCAVVRGLPVSGLIPVGGDVVSYVLLFMWVWVADFEVCIAYGRWFWVGFGCSGGLLCYCRCNCCVGYGMCCYGCVCVVGVMCTDFVGFAPLLCMSWVVVWFVAGAALWPMFCLLCVPFGVGFVVSFYMFVAGFGSLEMRGVIGFAPVLSAVVVFAVWGAASFLGVSHRTHVASVALVPRCPAFPE